MSRPFDESHSLYILCLYSSIYRWIEIRVYVHLLHSYSWGTTTRQLIAIQNYINRHKFISFSFGTPIFLSSTSNFNFERKGKERVSICLYERARDHYLLSVHHPSISRVRFVSFGLDWQVQFNDHNSRHFSIIQLNVVRAKWSEILTNQK